MKMFFCMAVMLFISCSAQQQEEQKTAVENDLGLVIYNADSARNDFERGNGRILSFGLRAMRISKELNDSLCKLYHFVDFEAAGCEVTDAFVEGVNEYNTEMIRLLEGLNGKGWYDEYCSIVDTLDWENDVRYENEENMYRNSDSVEQAQEVEAQKAYRKRMDEYKKKLEAEKGK